MSRFLSAFVVLIVLLVLCQSAYEKERDSTEQDDFTRTFEQPIDRVYLAAVQVAASHWHLQYSDKETRTLSFSTGRNMRVWQGFDRCLEHPMADRNVTEFANLLNADPRAARPAC